MTDTETIHPECWDAVLAILNDEQAKQRKLHHPNMVRGIDCVLRRLEDLRPDERSLLVKLDGLTADEVLALKLPEIGLEEWAGFLSYKFSVHSVGDLLDLGWAPIYALQGVGRKTLWLFTDALTSVGLAWPQWTVDGHVHPARPKS